ncbi:Protein sey1 [Porphyridium purpureum]|uniref:Protein sey1 n=1 Tax=Porphyridium purpureum TaxID=35688 RepID=A0A5J4Z2V3_PORPP|nr:Protein sey1 [Porphyridium purpureum]|eukprot:POR2371..scf208_2
MAAGVAQVVDASGSVLFGWLDGRDAGPELVRVVGILGPQGSGKSTLLNALFGTQFAVASGRAAVGAATTKGVCAQMQGSTLMMLDVEGADARERGPQGKAFAARCAAFAARMCDALVLNMWFNELGRGTDTVGFSLLKAVFASFEDGAAPTMIRVVLRDADSVLADEGAKNEVIASVLADARDLWDAAGRGAMPLENAFQISVTLLPHMKYQKDAFSGAVAALGNELQASMNSDEYSKGLSADQLELITGETWDSVAQIGATSAGAGGSRLLPPNADIAIRIEHAFTVGLDLVNAEAQQMLDLLDQGEKVQSLGAASSQLVLDALDAFDAQVGAKSEDIGAAKERRTQLEQVADDILQGVFIRQLQILRENAMSAYKAASSDEIPTDYAMLSATSMFKREAEASIRPGSSWSYDSELMDLHELLTEISNQKKRFLANRIESSQAQQSAMYVLQMQQAQMNQIQQQAMGGISGQWNAQAMYRPPDTNFNVTLGYQPGRTTINLGMVPEEGAAGGGSGFTAGLGPLNMGVNLNVTI